MHYTALHTQPLHATHHGDESGELEMMASPQMAHLRRMSMSEAAEFLQTAAPLEVGLGALPEPVEEGSGEQGTSSESEGEQESGSESTGRSELQAEQELVGVGVQEHEEQAREEEAEAIVISVVLVIARLGSCSRASGCRRQQCWWARPRAWARG